MEVKKMSKVQKYEAYKKYLQSLNLPWQEYEQKLKEWCIKNKF